MMDYCSIDSEVLESLDYLRPSVKRIKYPNRDKLNYASHNNYSNDIKILKSYKRKVTKYENSYTNKPGSSTSLVLQKSSERSVLEKYSIISYTDIQRSNEILISNNKCYERNITSKNKPLIQVTVTPKTGDPQAKLMRKRRQVVNQIQTSVSNQESSIQNKNIYLVVSGRRKEKIYELKTTESAKFCNNYSDLLSKDDELSLRELPNFKHIIKSLNMDKKKKKNRKKREMGEAIGSSQVREVGDAVEDYYKPNTRNEFRTDLGSHRSRVTIYGRVGLTEDDRYVMDCSATLNRKPAENYVQVERSRFLGSNKKEQTCNTPVSMAGYKTDFHNNNNQRNTSVQADFPDDITCYKLMDRSPFYRSPMRSKESQSTQVDFRIHVSNNADNAMISSQKKDEMVQCKCNEIEQFADKVENKKLKESQSPFVIISVYPKPDSSEAAKPIKPIAGDTPNRRVQQRNKEFNTGVNVKGRANIKKDNEIKATTPRSPRPSRSPSPSRKLDNKKMEPKSRKFPLNQTTVRRATSPIERTQQNKVIQKTIAKKFKPETTTQVYRQQTKKVALKSFEDKGTNTEHLQAKKALVDQYTKQIAGQIRNSNRYARKSDSGSKDTSTTIYDFEDNLVYRLKDQNQRGRKSENSPPRYYKNEVGSLDNYLLTADNASPGDVTPSSETFKDWPIDDLRSKSQTSRIRVRDSLEISHRREGSAGLNVRNTQTSYDTRNASYDSKYLAPIKHYTGDKCAVPNPVARDKEIRELLGVNKGRATPPNKQKKQFLETLHAHAQTHPNPVNCYYQDTSEKKICTEFHVLKCQCQCCQPLQNDTMPPEKYPPSELEGIKRPQAKSNTIQAPPSEPLQQERTSLYQQMILNRNIQVFLQVEQFTKQKPIVLSRRQYDKVKKTIEETISKTRHKKNKSVHKGSIVSVGEVRKKSKRDKGCKCSKEAQTVIREAPERLSGYRDCCKVIPVIPEPQPKQDLCFPSSSTNSTTEPLDVIHKPPEKKSKDKKKSSKSKNELSCVCPSPVSNQNDHKSVVRQAVSSMEIRYASISYLKHVTFSSTNVESTSIPLTCTRNDSSSLYTIFKGYRKSPTPNLGTSAFSLYSDVNPDTKILKILMPPRDPKPKKPFLKRLMSCLVMRSTRASEIRTCIAPTPLDASANSSIDSYHISTSLGPVEISSSLYDTTASFYSTHSIHPITSKMKRGFFSSVRGFINRKN